jgi:hypothetical protein
MLIDHGNKLGDKLDNKFDTIKEMNKAIPLIKQEAPKKVKSRLSLIPIRSNDIEDAEILNKLKQMR